MKQFDYETFNKRYDKFKKNNLPTPFWDEERQVREYVCFNKDNLNVYCELSYGLEDITLAGLYYPYIDKHTESHYEGKKIIKEIVVGHNHGHSFEEVIKALYYSPESFKIEKKDYKYYSEQELDYLRRIQNYLKLIGVKDVEDKISNARFKNKLHDKYNECPIMTMNSRNINNLIKGKIDFKVIKYYKQYTPDNHQPHKALIVDEKDNFRLYVDVIATKCKKRKDIKGYHFTKKYKDNSKVIVEYINIIEVL